MAKDTSLKKDTDKEPLEAAEKKQQHIGNIFLYENVSTGGGPLGNVHKAGSILRVPGDIPADQAESLITRQMAEPTDEEPEEIRPPRPKGKAFKLLPGEPAPPAPGPANNTTIARPGEKLTEDGLNSLENELNKGEGG